MCQGCGTAWKCNDITGDGSDTDCRWFESVLCPDCLLKKLFERERKLREEK